MLSTLIITFREIIEAGLIVGIVLAATRGVPRRGRWVAIGVAGGVAGAVMVALFADAIAGAFSGSGQEYFNATALLIAVAMLTWHNVWMSSHGREMAREMRELGAQVAGGERDLAAMAVVVGLAVLREGSELVLFLYGVAASGGTNAASMALGGALGVAAGAGVSALTYFGLASIPAHRLFAVTSGLITLLAAGLAAQAVAFLQQAGWLEQLSTPLWDTSHILAQDSIGGRLLHTLIGYTDQPDAAQLIAYALTVAAILLLMRTQRPRRGAVTA